MSDAAESWLRRSIKDRVRTRSAAGHREPLPFAPAPKHVFSLFHSDPDIVEVTVKWRDGSGGIYSRSEDDVEPKGD